MNEIVRLHKPILSQIRIVLIPLSDSSNISWVITQKQSQNKAKILPLLINLRLELQNSLWSAFIPFPPHCRKYWALEWKVPLLVFPYWFQRWCLVHRHMPDVNQPFQPFLFGIPPKTGGGGGQKRWTLKQSNSFDLKWLPGVSSLPELPNRFSFASHFVLILRKFLPEDRRIHISTQWSLPIILPRSN